MTMQIAMRATDGFLVASDTLIRTQPGIEIDDDDPSEYRSSRETPNGIRSWSKVRFTRPHDLAVAMVGTGQAGSDPAQELADYLSRQSNIGDSLPRLMRHWGEDFVKTTWPEQEPPGAALLVVDPRAEHINFWNLLLARESREVADLGNYVIHGNEANPAIFWPEYFRCHKQERDLKASTRIAAFTILMGSELNPYGVGGVLARFIREGAESGLWGDQITPNIMAWG
jgi:hypothetical protein